MTGQGVTAIGGLGGSGTRVFAAMLRHAGVFIGSDLNGPLDNLWFSVLFKRRSWTIEPPPDEEVARSLRLFREAMTEGLADRLSPEDHALIESLRRELLPEGDWQTGAKSQQAVNLLQSTRTRAADGAPWGWKEPNTHLFLRHLDRLLPDFRYIHIVRDGLDMAFSANTWQMRHWGHLYDLTDDPDTPPEVRQLRYWLAANDRAVSYGTQQMAGRFMVIRYEDFCAAPEPFWHRIRNFVGADAGIVLPEDLVQPTTIGRAEGRDLSMFPDTLLERVADFQSSLNPSSTDVR